MRDTVLHEINKINFFGVKDVNPALVSAVTVTVVIPDVYVPLSEKVRGFKSHLARAISRLRVKNNYENR